MRRYSRTSKIKGGLQFGTAEASFAIYNAVNDGRIAADVYVIQEGERLDTLAGQFYTDGRLWWVIAAASGVGWGLQVPPGTRLLIPKDIKQISSLVG